MILYLIRHGQSTNNLLAEQLTERPGPFPYETYMKQRVAEPPLTELGERQANRLRNSFGDVAISRLYCSPMLRTMQTMQPVADALGTSPSVWLDLHEHGGIFHRPGTDAEAVGHPGLSRAEMRAKFPGYRLDGVGEDGWWHGAEEDRAACLARAVRVAEALQQMAKETGEDVESPLSATAPFWTVFSKLFLAGCRATKSTSTTTIPESLEWIFCLRGPTAAYLSLFAIRTGLTIWPTTI